VNVAAEKLAPALAAGNAIVLKPSDLAHRYEQLSVQGLAKLAAVEWKVLYGG